MNVSIFIPVCISWPPLIVFNLFFHVVQLSEFLNPNCGEKDLIKRKRKITSVLCLWAVLCETIKLQEMLSMRQTNQEQNAECSLENPQQLNHPTWEKHTLNANNISNEQPLLNGALARTWRYISNISGMFKYIAGTHWNAFSCIFCFFRCIFVNMTLPQS